VARHFAACSFSIRVTRSFDAVRLVTVACLVAIADAVMRIRTCDVPSLLCLSYSGLADGPGGAFGFEVRCLPRCQERGPAPCDAPCNAPWNARCTMQCTI